MTEAPFEVRVPPSATVELLKSAIQDKVNIPPFKMRLIALGQFLENAKQLSDYNIVDRTTVYLMRDYGRF
jgi:hypothetical protein